MNSMKKLITTLLTIFCIGVVATIYINGKANKTNNTLQINIYGQLNGELEPCLCGGNRKGGLAKLKTVTIASRKETKDIPIISQGNLLSYTGAKVTDSLILLLMPRLGFDACAIGWLEMIDGAEFFVQNMNSTKINWVSCNLKYKGKALAPEYRIIKSGKHRIGVTSVVSPVLLQTPLLKGKLESLEALPAVEKVTETIEKLNKKADHIVVITHLDPKSEKMLFDKYITNPAVVFSRVSSSIGHDTSGGYKENNIYNGGERGRYITVLYLEEGKGVVRFNTKLIDNRYDENPEIKARINKAIPMSEQNPVKNDELLIKKLEAEKNKIGGERFVFYYSPACPDCHQIMQKYLLKVAEGRKIKLELVDLNVDSNYKQLLVAQQKYQTTTKEIPVVLYKGVFYDGKQQITALLERIIR
jgi:2',3'-cyclic-nucleotide 2'-phosphodiesterase (5'-nucleotidase family)